MQLRAPGDARVRLESAQPAKRHMRRANLSGMHDVAGARQRSMRKSRPGFRAMETQAGEPFVSEQAQIKALAAAGTATAGIAALITFGREGGDVDSAVHYDILYPLARALRLALESVRDARGSLDGDDGQLLAAAIHWIES